MLSTVQSALESLQTSQIIRWQGDALFAVRHRYLFFLLCWLLFLSVSLHLVLLPYTYYSMYNPLPIARQNPLLIKSTTNNSTLQKLDEDESRKHELFKRAFSPLHRMGSILYVQCASAKKNSMPLPSNTCTFANFIELVISDCSNTCLKQHFNARLTRSQAEF